VGENLQYRAIGHFADTSTADLTEEVGPDPDDYCGPACGGGNPDCFSAELVNGLPSTVLTHGVGAGQFRAATAGTVYVDFCCGAICAQSAPPTHPDDERSITVVSP
jgi:hypothetical protein